MRINFSERLIWKAVIPVSAVAAATAVFFVLFGFTSLEGHRVVFSFYPVAFFGRLNRGSPAGFDWDNAEDLHPGIRHVRIVSSGAVINAIRIDTEFSNLEFYSTPRCDAWGESTQWTDSAGKSFSFIKETRAQRTRDFLIESRNHGKNMVVAVNAGAGWTPFNSGNLPFSSPSAECVRAGGVIISEGELVSEGEGPSFIVNRNGAVYLDDISSDTDISDIKTAVSGLSWCLADGEPMHTGGRNDPRTGIGVSQDRRYVYFIVVDGRRFLSGGVTQKELGALLQRCGGHTGINMDGGGSTTMAIWNNSSGKAELLNTPSDGWFMLAREREVSNNLGVYDTGGME